MNIKVLVRLRCSTSNDVIVTPTSIQLQQQEYELDQVYSDDVTNHEIYESGVRGLVADALSGFNSCVFAYGQTSSGKTYTMKGTVECPGIIPLAIRDIFTQLTSSPLRFTIKMSYFEIYNENIIDLLSPSSTPLKIHESLTRQTYIGGLTSLLTTSSDEGLQLFERGERNRCYGSTDVNERSSRSHCLFQIHITCHDDINGSFDSILNLVDLAGSERLSQTHANGIRKVEGMHINKSLLTLSTCIQKLSQSSLHIPYRDSKLTRILQPSLSGHSKTTIICTINPGNVEETVTTLGFGMRARCVSSIPVVVRREGVQELKDRVERMKSEIYSLRSQIDKNGIASISDANIADKERKALENVILLTAASIQSYALYENLIHKQFNHQSQNQIKKYRTENELLHKKLSNIVKNHVRENQEKQDILLQLEDAKNTLSFATNQLDASERRNCELQEQCTEFKSQMEENKSKFVAKELRFLEIEALLDNTVSKYQESESKRVDTESKLDKSYIILEEIQQTLEITQSEKASLVHQLLEAQQQSQNTLKMYSELEKKYNNDIQIISKSLDEHSVACSALTVQNDALKAQLTINNSRTMRDGALELRIQEQNDEICTLNNKINLQNILITEKETLEELIKTRDNENYNLRESNALLNEKISVIVQENKKLAESNVSQISALLQENTTQSEKIMQLDKSIAEFCEERDTLLQGDESKTSQIIALLQLKDTLNEEITALQEKISNLSEERDLLLKKDFSQCSKISELFEKINFLDKRLSEASIEIDKLTEKISGQASHITTLLQEKKAVNDSFQQLSDTYQATYVQLQTFKDKKKYLENHKLVIDADLQTLSEVIKTTLLHWTDVLVSYETRFASLQESIILITEKCINYQQALQKSTQRYKEGIELYSALKQDHETLKQDHISLKNTSDVISQEYKETDQKLQTLLISYELLQKEKIRQEENFSNESQTQYTQISELRDELSRISQKHDLLGRERDALCKALNEAWPVLPFILSQKEKHESTEKEIQTLLKDSRIIYEKYQCSKKTISELRQALDAQKKDDTYKQKCVILTAQNQQLSGKLDRGKQLFEEKAIRVGVLQEQVTALESTLVNALEERTVLRTFCEELCILCEIEYDSEDIEILIDVKKFIQEMIHKVERMADERTKHENQLRSFSEMSEKQSSLEALNAKLVSGMNQVIEDYQVLDDALHALLYKHHVSVSVYPHPKTPDFLSDFHDRVIELCSALQELDSVYKRMSDESSLRALMSLDEKEHEKIVKKLRGEMDLLMREKQRLLGESQADKSLIAKLEKEVGAIKTKRRSGKENATDESGECKQQ